MEWRCVEHLFGLSEADLPGMFDEGRYGANTALDGRLTKANLAAYIAWAKEAEAAVPAWLAAEEAKRAAKEAKADQAAKIHEAQAEVAKWLARLGTLALALDYHLPNTREELVGAALVYADAVAALQALKETT